VFRVVTVDPLNPDREVLRDAAEVLRKGGLVAFPTETVYGLGADAMNPSAVRKIFEVKRRPPDNPLIVHICSLNMLFEVVEDVDIDIIEYFKVLWPGPFTAILRKKRTVPDITTAGLPLVAVRMPAHPVALGLIEELGSPIAAPSANRSGKPSPTRAEHVIEDLGDSVDLIIDGGETFFGIESTIVDLTREPPTLLRPGPIDPEVLEKILKKKIVIPGFARGYGEAEKALAPGMKHRHYAPDKGLVLIEYNENLDACVEKAVMDLLDRGLKPCLLGYEEFRYVASKFSVEFISMGSIYRPYEVAKNLYKGLREVDKTKADLCIALGIYERGIGLAIMNRLRKASGHNIIKCGGE
jgi:L-threonylcarbamoyladenylate synthase